MIVTIKMYHKTFSLFHLIIFFSIFLFSTNSNIILLLNSITISLIYFFIKSNIEVANSPINMNSPRKLRCYP
uniref:Putative secreted protein n=1 Tax=Panstrongylus lignarius TaxID=156445 RepID=A0A224Y5W4_9HEMI